MPNRIAVAQKPVAPRVADSQARVDNSILNVKNQSKPARRDLFETPELLKGTRYEYKPADVFKPAPAQTTRAQKKQPVAPRANVPTPKLDAAIDSLSKATRAMPEGLLKQSLTTVKASLELARTAQKNGDTVAYTKAIGTLSQNVFKTVGELVKTFGQDTALATQAAEQLGKVAGVLGKGVKVVGAIEDLSRVLRGTTISGAAVSKAQRADAAVNLVTTFLPGPVGTAATLAKAQLEWCYNHIGVPAKQALTEYGLKRLFGGKSPEQLKAEISSLPVNDPAKAQWALNKLFRGTFPNTTSGFSQATASSLWERFIAREMQDYNPQMQLLNEHARTRPGTDPMIDTLRTTMAERYQRAALRFLDQQVREAKGSWGV